MADAKRLSRDKSQKGATGQAGASGRGAASQAAAGQATTSRTPASQATIPKTAAGQGATGPATIPKTAVGQGAAAAQATAKPARSTQHDLIIRTSVRCTTLTPYPMRWKFTDDDEMIDLNRVQDYDYRLLGPACLTLKRIKIFQLDRERLIQFLWTIGKNRNNSLEKLEIDTLELAHPKEARARFHFYSLQSLVIDEVLIVDEKTNKPIEPVPVTTASASFLCPDMKMLQLGPNCIQYLIIGYPEEVHHLVIGPEPDFTRFRQFSKLRDLVVEDIEHSDLEAILQITYQKQLKRLYLYLGGVTRIDFQPDKNQLKFLKLLYARLRSRELIKPADRFRELIAKTDDEEFKVDFFFNGVKLDFEQEFDDYQFGEKLINVHHRNVVTQAKLVTKCRSVEEVDYLSLFEEFFETKTNPPEKCKERVRLSFKFWKLVQIYPCIQCIRLINRDMEPLDPDLFIEVLKHSRAIRELHIRGSRFPATLYDRLADISCIKYTLVTLVHSDSYSYDLRLNYRRLLTDVFKHLTTFWTSHATRRVMLELIEQVPRIRNWVFRFWNSSMTPTSYYEIQLVRLRMKAPGFAYDELDDDDMPFYSLTIEFFDFGVIPNLNYTVKTKKTNSVSGLTEYFNRQENSLITAHPLDVPVQK